MPLKFLNACRDNEIDQQLIDRVQDVFISELAPYFDIVERAILPELSKLGEQGLVDKTLDDHKLLRHLISQLNEADNLQLFAETLIAHVKFEEQILFGACQNLMDKSALDSIGHYCAR